MKRIIDKFESMEPQKYEKVVRNVMRGIAVFSVIGTLIAIVTIIIGLCGIPIPIMETIILASMCVYIDYAIIMYHKEIGLW